MRSLESIVASLELCKKIPDGEFEDTALVWETYYSKYSIKPVVIDRKTSESTPHEFVENVYPAPTVVEIMKAIKKMKVCSSICPSNRDNGWFFNAHIRYELPVYGDTAEEAALKMWFKVKGIEVK